MKVVGAAYVKGVEVVQRDVAMRCQGGTPRGHDGELTMGRLEQRRQGCDGGMNWCKVKRIDDVCAPEARCRVFLCGRLKDKRDRWQGKKN